MANYKIIYNPFTKKFDYVNNLSSFTGGTVSSGIPIVDKVNNYSSLPLASSNSNKTYLVLNSQGNPWFPGSIGGTFYSKGLYYSNGSTWALLADVPYQATQTEVDNGVLDSVFITPLKLSNYSGFTQYLKTAIISLNGLTGTTQTFTNDSNIQIISTGTTHNIIWNGTLGDNRITSSSNWNTAYNSRISQLTVTGNSGPSTFVSNVLNIPNYSLSGLGGLPLTGGTLTGELILNGNITYGGTINNSLNGSNVRIPSHSSSRITFTNPSLVSIGSANNGGASDGHTLFLTNATGNDIIIINSFTGATAGESIITGANTNVTIPNNGSFWLQYNSTVDAWICGSSGIYNIQDTQISSSSKWNTAYNNRITGLTTTGTTGLATLINNVLNIPNYTSSGVTRSVLIINTDTTLPANPNTDYVVFISGTTTVTFPTAIGNTNNYTFIKTDTGTITTLATTSSQTIAFYPSAPDTTVTLTRQGTAGSLMSDSTNW